MSTTQPKHWQAKWIAPGCLPERLPVLCRSFRTEKKVENAVLYTTGLGLFEAYMNGAKVDCEVFAPFFDDYSETIQVMRYDVTDLIEKENLLELHLGDGWYKGRFGMIPRPGRWGSEYAAIAQLELHYEDGTFDTVCTDESWNFHLSHIVQSGFYDGETQDHTLSCGEFFPVKCLDWSTERLIDRDSPRLTVSEHIPVFEILQTPAGETVLDFGQNFAGWVEFDAEFPAGTCIKLEFGEILSGGNFYNENYRSAAAGFTVICSGERKTYRPRFTYFGFRYVRVSGWIGTPDMSAFRGCVIHSELPRTGWFECGHAGVQRLYENTLWSQRSNFVDIPTDCPQRDERLPWTGDAQVFCSAACYHMDSRKLYCHFLRLLRQDQLRNNGAVANYLPRDPLFAEPAAIWGDAAILIPMTLYRRYGDKKELEHHWPMMKDWAEFVLKQDDARGSRRLIDRCFQFGDWLALDGITETSYKGGTEDSLVATFYWYHTATCMAEAAAILDKTDEAARYEALAGEIRAAVFEEYFTPSGRLAVDTQTAYLLSLRFGLYPDRDRIVAGLLHRMEKDCWQLTSGFAAAPLICSILAENGLTEQAMRLLLRTEYPGWLYEIGLGATTIWERWNSMLPDGTVNPAGMNSFNHFSYGSVAQFMYEEIAGLKASAPGFTSVRFSPCIDVRLGWCSAVYDSISGRWESGWRIEEDGKITVTLTVPRGCTAEVRLPFCSEEAFTVEEGVFSLTYQPKIDIRKPFGENSLLSELVAIPEAKALLEQLAPQAVQMGLYGDREARAMTLAQFCRLPFLGITAAQADELITAIMAVIL